MIRNYIFTALRNMKREKLFAFMNITGLAIGIGCGFVIYKIIAYELSFDQYHPNVEHTYRLVTEFNHPQYGTGVSEGQVHPLGEALRNDFGITSVMTYYAGGGQVTIIDKNGNPNRFAEYKGIGYAEPDFFRLFHYDFLVGDPAKALINTGSVVITASLARKYFNITPDNVADVVGKSLTLNNSRTLLVTAVVKDLPENTDIPFALIGSYKDQPASNPYYHDGLDWNNYNSDVNCYLMLTDAAATATLEQQLPEFFLKYCGSERAAFAKYVLQPISRLHFDAVNNYNKRTVSYSRLTIMAAVGFFLVISACINFINLATAQAIKRAREIGVRKSLGVRKSQLVFQFLSETVFVSLISSLGGLVIAQALFILLEGILGYQLEVALFSQPTELLLVLAMAIGVGLLSGFYPALVMAGMNPIKALKNPTGSASSSGLLSLRRGLVVVQFVISQVLIIGTIVASRQMNLFLGDDLGFRKDAIIMTQSPGGSIDKLESFGNAIASKPGVSMVSFGLASPMSTFRVVNGVTHPKVRKEDLVTANLKTADEHYIDLFDLKLIAGRNLPREKGTNDAVVNRLLTKALGHETPENALGDTFGYSDDLEFRIVGVVEDFHSVSLHHPLENVILSNLTWNIRSMAVKIDTDGKNFEEIQATINEIKTEWDRAYPETIFDYTFLDDQIALLYQNEQRTSRLFQLFAGIAIFIGCLGLYGLVSYMANQKTKEIGIRKVMGASTVSILSIFSREMLILVAIAFALSAPLAWYVMSRWLQGFQFQVTLSPLFFAAALAASLAIALVTIGYKAIVASRANPVDSLRSE